VSAPLDLLTVGRISVDLYAEQLEVPLNQVVSFRKSVGGTATNVAIAAARLGHEAAVFTKVGNEPMGDFVRWALDSTFGVDTRFVGVDAELKTPLAFATMANPAEPDLFFYRAPSAPDLQITPNEVDRGVVETVPILWFPTGCLSAEPSRSTVHTMLGWRRRKSHTIIDLDWRPTLWTDAATATAQIDKVLAHVTIAVGNRDECEVAVGIRDPERAAEALLARGLTAAIVKMGGDGVLVATADGVRDRIAPFPVETMCGLGAGDAFGGAFCHGLLTGLTMSESARAGNAAGAIVASRLMCADDMPYLHEIEEIINA
jgi:5-dehydro-2-deoxygluconokinase